MSMITRRICSRTNGKCVPRQNIHDGGIDGGIIRWNGGIHRAFVVGRVQVGVRAVDHRSLEKKKKKNKGGFLAIHPFRGARAVLVEAIPLILPLLLHNRRNHNPIQSFGRTIVQSPVVKNPKAGSAPTATTITATLLPRATVTTVEPLLPTTITTIIIHHCQAASRANPPIPTLTTTTP